MIIEIYPCKQDENPVVIVPNYVCLGPTKLSINDFAVHSDTYQVLIYLPKKIIEVFPNENIIETNTLGVNKRRVSDNVLKELYTMIRTFLHEEQRSCKM